MSKVLGKYVFSSKLGVCRDNPLVVNGGKMFLLSVFDLFNSLNFLVVAQSRKSRLP